MHLIEQYCNDVDPFAIKSDFCVICLIPHLYFTVAITIYVPLFYTKSEIKTFDEKILPIMPCRFSNDLLAQKSLFLHVENLTRNKKRSGIKLLMNKVLIS